MNLLVIVHEYPPLCGGGGIHAFGMVQELSKHHSVTVITPRGKQNLPPDHNGTVFAVPVVGRVNAETQSRLSASAGFASFMITATVAALQLSFRYRFDFIHSYFAIPAGAIGMIVGKIRNIPHMVTLIEADLFDPGSRCTRPYGGFLRQFIRQTINSAALRTAISGYIADAARNHYAVTRPITVVPPGIPATTPVRNMHADSGLPEVTVVSAGRLVERKNFPALITAFSQMTFRLCRLVIIGDGPLRDELRQCAERLQIGDRVLFTGYITEEEKYRYLVEADIFALTSSHEGFGIVIAEAMNCGLPVVSTDTGGQGDLVIHEGNGFLAPSGDVAAVTRYLDILASDPPLRLRMGAMSHSRAPRFYNLTIAQQYGLLMETWSRQ